MSEADVQGADAPTAGAADRADVAALIAANKACGYEFHPAANLFPPMTDQEFDDLVADIKAHGLNEPIVLRGDQILEGRHRALACEKIGIKPTIQECPSNDPYAYVISANLHRRHVTAKKKWELIAKVLKARPDQSNRLIAKQLKADRDKVAEVRRELETTGGIPPVEKTVGADGKARKQPVMAKKATTASAAKTATSTVAKTVKDNAVANKTVAPTARAHGIKSAGHAAEVMTLALDFLDNLIGAVRDHPGWIDADQLGDRLQTRASAFIELAQRGRAKPGGGK